MEKIKGRPFLNDCAVRVSLELRPKRKHLRQNLPGILHVRWIMAKHISVFR